MDEIPSCCSDPQMVYSLNEGLCHFVQMLYKTPAPNKTIYIYKFNFHVSIIGNKLK